MIAVTKGPGDLPTFLDQPTEANLCCHDLLQITGGTLHEYHLSTTILWLPRKVFLSLQPA